LFATVNEYQRKRYLEPYARSEANSAIAYDAAWKLDQGREVRTEASMIKGFGTEMATEIIDQAMQTYGAMGMTKEMPLQLMASQVCTMRIY
jgi:acyl-CoA dehydrogenase